MHRIGQHESTRHIRHQAFRNASPRASFHEKILMIVRYATGCAILAVAMTYWSPSAGNIPAKINILPPRLTSGSNVSNYLHKVDRLSSVSFEERWSVVPTPSTVISGDKNRREAPRAERREKIPFSCELAFSRLVTEGNFSTRCIAGLETSEINT
jgi:hypothetical protein